MCIELEPLVFFPRFHDWSMVDWSLTSPPGNCMEFDWKKIVAPFVPNSMHDGMVIKLYIHKYPYDVVMESYV